MIHTVLICAVSFFSSLPMPGALQHLYHDTFDCTGVPQVTTAPARAPLTEVNRYFPEIPRYWPLLRGDDPQLVEKSRAWLAKGVQPGILLPTNLRKVWADSAVQRHILEAERAGALPVAELRPPLLRSLRAARYIWCLSGACPAAWYIPGGLSQDIALLPKGVYLVAPHWGVGAEFPLPNREMHLWGRTIMPLHFVTPSVGGVAAVLNPSSGAWAFAPAVKLRWRWMGIEFVRTNTGLHTTLAGRTVLALGNGFVSIWETLNAWQSEVLFVISKNFGWLVLVLGFVNLLALMLMIALRRRGTNGDSVI